MKLKMSFVMFAIFGLIFAAAYLGQTHNANAAAQDAETNPGKGKGGKGGGSNSLPEQQIEQIINAKGEVENGVLDIELARHDIGSVAGPEGVTFTPAFEINGDIFFQPVSHGQVFLNGDLALPESEVQNFIAALLRNGLVFQAFHQHLPMNPQIWFVHFRGLGDPLALARGLKAALNTTTTPFPQAPPQNPTTPLDPKRLEQILHGHASVGDEGVVTVWVYRKDKITIDGVTVNPQANVSTNIEFRPRGSSTADVVPDFSMTGEEVNPVVSLMRNQKNWYQGCLYNQETEEQPQLFFDHMLKSGDAYQLAQEIRQGLDLTDSE
jgi:hypothetical protein